MSKTIVFCADGTWNNPDQDQNEDRVADPTNVYKLFVRLGGEVVPGSSGAADEREPLKEEEKDLRRDGTTRQIAKYIHGVGDSHNPIIRLMGGAFGAGVISRVVRGYTFISRSYEPGADIVIVGFSRGAYTARALGGLIASQGLLAKTITTDKELAYRRGAEAWYRYRQDHQGAPWSLLAHLAEIAADLPAFVSHGTLRDADLVPIDRIAAVAVWDTVGAMGLPIYVGKGRRVDAFEFANTTLSAKVKRGLHAVALDERRNDFRPTLWDAAENVTQVIFPGAHSDVGGGYPTTNRESGLSDGALSWMIEQLEQLKDAGVLFSEVVQASPLAPDPAGPAHEPWAHSPWNLPGVSLGARAFPMGTPEHPSVAARASAGTVVAEPGTAPVSYRPTNRPG
jgi:uncharacterized protein (DUF2235 family)